MTTSQRALHVIAHTHWDREWYLSFEEFREKLVRTLDSVLDLLRLDEGWTHFHLDGQTAMIDDYLELRSERAEELRAHVSSGRLSCGPWVTLVDEFLVSGESIIRNLEDGIARAGELGRAMELGYLPDQFGHVGQMPQILRMFGIDRAIVWRGIPAAVSKTGFLWEAPDGSEVAVASLPWGYSNGMRLPSDPAVFERRIAGAESELEPFLSDGEPCLVMAGSDHERPNPDLPALLGGLRDNGRDVRIGSFTEYVARLEPPTFRWRGELRSAARANLLPNTYSVRPHQKLARARAEHLLERYAEPLAALVMEDDYPEAELSEAWRLLHLNGAHDSVCGCSTDEVARVVDDRTSRVHSIARRVAESALQRLSSQVDAPGTLRFNPSPFPRAGVPPLGWAVVAEEASASTRLPLRIDGDAVLVDPGGVHVELRLEDQADHGDLYTFDPGGPSEILPPSAVSKEEVVFEGGRATIHMSAVHVDAAYVRIGVQVRNEAADHRLRVLLRLPQRESRTSAASAFEIVERERLGEGGPSEPPSGCWPARGFVTAGGTGFLTEQVVEYELVDATTLALTLMRCTGTISRPEAIPARTIVAGPDVATPEAQLLGTQEFSFGVLLGDPDERLIEVWESYALPFMTAPTSGGGASPSSGTLLDIEAPALSSIRRVRGSTEVRVWNPWPHGATARIGDASIDLGPHRIRTVRL